MPVPCGGTYFENNGYISSPDFNSLSDRERAFCVYKITVPLGRACIEFVAFEIRMSGNYVSVYEGVMEDRRLAR